MMGWQGHPKTKKALRSGGMPDPIQDAAEGLLAVLKEYDTRIDGIPADLQNAAERLWGAIYKGTRGEPR